MFQKLRHLFFETLKTHEAEKCIWGIVILLTEMHLTGFLERKKGHSNEISLIPK